MTVHDEQLSEHPDNYCEWCNCAPCRCDADYDKMVDDYLMGLEEQEGEDE